MVDLVASTAAVLRRRRLPFAKFLARRVVRRASRIAGVSIDRPNPVETAATVRCPTAIIHGTDDLIVPIQDASRLVEAFPSEPCWFEITGAKHIDVVDIGGDDLLARIARFLDEAGARSQVNLSQAPVASPSEEVTGGGGNR
jgi:fermentation-respiration switch protein FrsA (DUF1100 family)